MPHLCLHGINIYNLGTYNNIYRNNRKKNISITINILIGRSKHSFLQKNTLIQTYSVNLGKITNKSQLTINE